MLSRGSFVCKMNDIYPLFPCFVGDTLIRVINIEKKSIKS